MRKRDLAILMLSAFAIFFSLHVCNLSLCISIYLSISLPVNPSSLSLSLSINPSYIITSLIFDFFMFNSIYILSLLNSMKVIFHLKRRGIIYLMNIQLSTKLSAFLPPSYLILTVMVNMRFLSPLTMPKFRSFPLFTCTFTEFY